MYCLELDKECDKITDEECDGCCDNCMFCIINNIIKNNIINKEDEIMSKKIVQVCFSLKSGDVYDYLDMNTLKNKMIDLKSKLKQEYGEDGFEVRSCHLTRRMCIEKSFTTDVPDLFKEIFGDNYVCELTEDTFAEAMDNINKHREELSEKADKLVILAGGAVTNVALELALFTKNKVMIL